MIEDYERSYLAGIFDGEGCVYWISAKSRCKLITIDNTDKFIIKEILRIFKGLNIKYHHRKYKLKSGKIHNRISITGFDNFVKFYSELGVYIHGVKYGRLVRMINSYKYKRVNIW